MEHRWGERVTLDCPVRLEFQHGPGTEGRLRNASISGALIDTAARLPMYTMVNVVIPAASAVRLRTVELPACVVRTAPDGVAVEWRDMAVSTLIALLRDAGGDESRLCTRDHAFG
jgi:hypothetical protein